MPPIFELASEAVALSRAPMCQLLEYEAGAATLADRVGLKLFDSASGNAAKLDSGLAELKSIRFPELNQHADFTFQVQSGNELRSVNVHLPPNFNPSKPTPTYFLMDGAQYGDPEGEMLSGYHWSNTADRNGFAAISLVQSEASAMELPPRYAALFGKHSTWRSQFGLTNPSNIVDDVSYFDNVLRGVRGAMNVEKINLVGFCDGGCLAHGLASRLPLNGIATVGSTIFKDTAVMPLPGARAIFATMKDDLILPEAGGAGRTFGRGLAMMGHTKVEGSLPLEQGDAYARVNQLVAAKPTVTDFGVERTWVKPVTGEIGVKQWSLNEGGHNWPGTKFSSLSKTKSEQIAPDTARAFNQKIVDFFEAPRGLRS